METERRALTEDEAKLLFAQAYERTSWLGVIGQSIGAGGCCTVLVVFASALLAWITGFELSGYVGGSRERLLLITKAVATIIIFFNFAHYEVTGRRRHRQRRARILNSNDLIVQHHQLKKVMLVREPEHGSPMYFVQSDDDTILFILEGQNELDEDWEQYPLRLKNDEKPRAKLKLIHDPETKDCLLEAFSGRALPTKTCHIINLGPGQWPASGNKIKGPWETLPKRYRLKQFKPVKE